MPADGRYYTQWNPDCSNPQGRQESVWKIVYFKKSRVQLGEKRLLVGRVGSSEKASIPKIGISLNSASARVRGKNIYIFSSNFYIVPLILLWMDIFRTGKNKVTSSTLSWSMEYYKLFFCARIFSIFTHRESPYASFEWLDIA